MSHLGNRELRNHIMAPGHDYKKCAECIGRLQVKGITTIRTIVSIRNPKKDIIESVADMAANLPK